MHKSISQLTLVTDSRGIMASFYPWLMLIARSALFLFFQLSIALVLAIAGPVSAGHAFQASARWWTLMVILANLSSIYLLMRVFKTEGGSYFEAIHFSRATVKTDLVWFLLSTVIALPIVAIPMTPLASLLFGDPMAPTLIMFRPIPAWALVLSFLLPLTIAFAELPTYFGYCRPRLFRRGETQIRYIPGSPG